uniref:Histone-lysine N-methyltransferase SETDB2-like n=1 Tax=Xiphophorus maculatus TaxID=8083 RepID=A0A3B5RF21_XIPMA
MLAAEGAVCVLQLTAGVGSAERAKSFWAEKDVEQVFTGVFQYLDHLKQALQKKTALDKGTGPSWLGSRLSCVVLVLSAMPLTPCGQSLRNFQDVESFLSVTESYDVLQVDFFTFNHLVQLDPTPLPAQPRADLSRGAEPVPVELVVGEGRTRPAGFRYRKDRWPHGCFLSRGAALFDACCDCSDGCGDARHCACVAMTTRGQGYSYQRLLEPVHLFECGPWCGCDRARCQNRLVQRGVRVRLQVFETEDRGWGVRCRDDLDRGTFVCIYAGVVLQRAHSPTEPLPPKLTRAELPSDDEVEVVTEWLAPPILEVRSDLLEAAPGSAPSTQHVPVIQRPGESSGAAQNHDQVGFCLSELRVAVAMDSHEDGSPTSFKRGAEREEVCFIDASKEGNVGRFINHSCQPNLFIQNVFTDSHDPAFPVIAFFTNRVVKAGTELTWNYSSDVHTSSSEQEQEKHVNVGSNFSN